MSEPEVQVWHAPEHVAGQPGRSGPLTASRLAEIQEQAYAEGMRRGLEEGRRKGEAEVAVQATRMRELVNSIEPQSNLLDDAMIDQLGELVLAISRHFIRREFSRSPDEIVQIVREALGVLPVTESRIRILLHPEDAVLVRDKLQADAMSHHIEFLEDLSMTRGGARVETDSSVVDASIEARFGAIAAGVFGEQRSPGTGDR